MENKLRNLGRRRQGCGLRQGFAQSHGIDEHGDGGDV